MSKEKQIAEMANDIEVIACNGRVDFYRTAEILYNAGYRKQSEGEWEVCSDEYEICASEFVCSNCKESFCSSELTDEQFFEMMKYCPNCGAKMRKEDEGK